MQAATHYADLLRLRPPRWRLRALARKAALFALSLPARGPVREEWILFPYYHHVLDDERRGFERQLRYLRRFGEFLSLDDAIAALGNPALGNPALGNPALGNPALGNPALGTPAGIGGRYFCITFDDGFRNCLTNALPILLDHRCPAAFFLPTDYIGRDLDEVRGFYATSSDAYPLPLEFLRWEDCRQMRDAGMTFGSHTRTHLRPVDVDRATFEAELLHSKARIEAELDRPCHHFACPWGRPGIDFDPQTLAEQVRRLGFRSLLTGRRGRNRRGSDPFFVRRDQLLAGEGTYVLRYFFSRNV